MRKSLEELKTINQPEETIPPEVIADAEETMLKPYSPTVYAIPQEQWEAMATLQLAQSKATAEMQANIAELPQWEHVRKLVNPVLAQIHEEHYHEIEGCKSSLQKSMERTRSEMAQQMTQELAKTSEKISREMCSISQNMLETLKEKAVSLTGLHMKWMCIGAILLCFTRRGQRGQAAQPRRAASGL